MATVGERLATLEERYAELRKDLDDVHNYQQGGGGIAFHDSVRGRLHQIETSLAGIVLRRKVGLDMLKGWQAAVLMVCGVATAAAAWYAALHA